MYGFFYRFGTWLLGKLGAAVLIVVIALVGVGVWLYVHDQVDAETRRLEYLATLRETQAQLVAEQARLLEELQRLRADAQVQEERIAQAHRVIAKLHELKSWWDDWFGNREQQLSNQDQLTRLQGLVTEAESELQVLRRQIGQGEISEQHLKFQLQSVEQDLVSTEQTESAAAHYLRDAWDRSKVYLLIAVVGFFIGPSVVKLFSYYLVAPWLARGKPIRFAVEMPIMPHVRKSHVSTIVTLWPGEVLRVKEAFLQSSDDGMTRKTRFVFDWAIPLTSVACGLTELVELRNAQAGERAVITLSNSDDPHIELSVIEIPEGASLILRPSFLVGVITENEEKVEIRRRWTLLRWQAWITLQFRFFEFVGPCRLVVAGSRGVREERLRTEREGSRPARRTNQLATIGFTPNLDYLPVRAETFWGYYRNMNPLFDDLFAGEGLFVLQETSTGPAGGRPQRFWAGIWNALLKVFGI